MQLWQIVAALGGTAAAIVTALVGYRTWRTSNQSSFINMANALVSMYRQEADELRKRNSELETENAQLRAHAPHTRRSNPNA